MAKPEYSTETKEFGESLKYDPTFKGPLSKRSCTDVICLLLFFAFIGGWVAVGFYAFINGDPVRLLTPVDSNGLRCGLDEGVTDKPYLFFFDLSKCASATIITGCDTPQVCVRECPTDNFYYDLKTYSAADLVKKMICIDESYNQQIHNFNDADAFAKNNTCAKYYLKSKEAYRRCLPESVASLGEGWESITFEDVGSGAATINILAEAKELGHKILQDLDESWPFVLGFLGIAMILCFIYIVLMRWFAGLMIWFSLFGVIGLLIYCCYASYVKYAEMKDAEEKATTGSSVRISSRIISSEQIKEEVNEILEMKDTWLVFLIISAILLVIILLLVLFLRSRIRIAIALIKEASKAVGSITSTLFFPLFPWFLQLFVIGWFIAVLLFLAGSSASIYIASISSNCTTSCEFLTNTIQDGDRCFPEITYSCEKEPLCNFKCQFSNYEKGGYVNYLHAYNIFGVFWGLFFISGLGEMMLAATFATWYWTFRKSEVPFFTLTVSISRTLRYHMGTVAFGSLILAICRVIRVILEYINHKLKKYDNAFVKAIMCCLRCFFWCLEKFIKFINKNAYIMCAIHGKNFCRSAKDAFNLLMRNVIRVFVLDKVTDFLLFLGKMLITAGMCALAFFVFTKEIKYYNDAIPTLNYSIIPVVFIGFGTYFIASIFFGVYSMAVDTLFLCFLEDCERNDGSTEKPYFMSKELMKILHKKNK